MKRQTLSFPLLTCLTALTLACGLGFSSSAEAASKSETSANIGFVNFRKAVEESKLGKQEQSSFEALQNQMESSLMEIQKQLNEITAKLSDEDYLDGLSPEAENELKHKYRSLSQDLSMTQNQYMQTLQQANMKIIQSLQQDVADATKEVAQSKNLDLVVNEEAAFFHRPSLDVTDQVISLMNKKFDREQAKKPNDTKSK